MNLQSTNLQQRHQKYKMRERIVFSINGVGKTGYPYAEEWYWTLISHHTPKIMQNGLKT